VKARVIHSGAGGISESDILLAKASAAPVIAVNDIKGVLEGMLSPEKVETFLGYAKVLEVFDISKLGNIAGCVITEGKVERGSGVRLLRDDVVIHEGELSTLKRFKDEVESVVSGTECGMGFKDYHDIKKGDQIECFSVAYKDRKLD